MRKASLLALPLLSLFAIACGGQVDGVPTGHDSDHTSDPNHQNPQNHLPTDTIAGSFDLTFTHVTATPMYSAGTNPPVTPPSQGANARLDIWNATDDSAQITPRWGQPAHLGIETTSASVVASDMIDEEPSFSGSSTYGYTTDRISSITFGRTSSGGFDGTFTAVGVEETFSGDVGYEANLAITGTIDADKTAPESKIDAIPSYGLLPWQPVTVRYAEPPSFAEGLQSSHFVHISPGGSIQGIVTDDTSGLLQATAILGGWQIPSATLSVDPFYDPANNVSTPTSNPITYLNIGSPRASFEFERASTYNANEYGTSTTLFSYLSDSTCESGSCLEIGVLDRTKCDTPDAGFAGIVTATEAGTLHVRYRILADVDKTTNGPGASVVPESDVFTLETATPGVLPTSQPIGFAATDLKTIPATLGLTQATDWKTIDVSVPANGSQEVGFALKIGNWSCGGGPFYDPNRLVVLVDSVTFD